MYIYQSIYLSIFISIYIYIYIGAIVDILGVPSDAPLLWENARRLGNTKNNNNKKFS